VAQLPAIPDGKALAAAVELAHRLIDVVLRQRLLQFVDADSPAGELVGVGLDAHGKLLRTVDLHLGDAGDGRQTLRELGFRVFVHQRQRQRRDDMAM
jgi:hypothetical protein